MKVAVKPPRVSGNCDVDIQQEFGWRRYDGEGLVVWAKGYGKGVDGTFVAAEAARWRGPPTVEQAGQLLNKLDGHFAFVIEGSGWTLAAVDAVRSIPLAFAQSSDGWHVDDQAERLRARLGLDEVVPDAALALAMAGYTINASTLFRGLQQLSPGELALFTPDQPPERQRYYMYRPWRADKPAYDPEKARTTLAETTLKVIDNVMQSVGDRLLVVPLSAGLDSRLIVSAARHLGYKNIRTFAYGRKGNHEAKASKVIAERLGYDWRFVPTDTAFMRRHYASADWQEYLNFADSHQSVPFVQDLPQIQQLKHDGYIPDDAVLCNGNSGDYISGNHIVPPMDEVPKSLTTDQRHARITGTLFSKHFALWSSLQTPARRKEIERQLSASLALADAVLGAPENDYGLYEYAEFQDRQCKYVITGQRIYEFLGHEWRLPLWDRAFLDLFETIPLEGKIGQRLYIEMLEAENWADVWKDLPVNKKTIKPEWIRPLRWLAKAAHAPVSKKSWHRFERRYFQYWMELGGQSAIRPYKLVALDRRGARHGAAWLTEAYLARHGVAFDGTPVNRNV